MSALRRVLKEPILSLQCLQYQTDQIADLKKVEKLNDRFFLLMARGEEAAGAAHSCCTHYCTVSLLCCPFLVNKLGKLTVLVQMLRWKRLRR